MGILGEKESISCIQEENNWRGGLLGLNKKLRMAPFTPAVSGKKRGQAILYLWLSHCDFYVLGRSR